MLKAKYKMHRFVNVIFYGLFWLSGYVIGYGMKGVNIGEKITNIINNFFS